MGVEGKLGRVVEKIGMQEKLNLKLGIILTFIIGKYCKNGCEWLSKIAVHVNMAEAIEEKV